MKKIILFTLLSFSFWINTAAAFNSNATHVGLAYYSENFLGETANSASGSTGFLGEASYPLTIKYDYAMTANWFLAPQLIYSLIPRKANGDTAKVTITELNFQFGQNFSAFGSNNWDWSFGPGYFKETIKGNGGTTVLSNGTGTSTFALPGRSSNIQKITLNGGVSYTYTKFRFGFDLITESFFSSKKRTQNMMLSVSYKFGG